MSNIETAVDGCTVEVTTSGVTGAPPSITSLPSAVDKAEGKGIFSKELKVTLAGLTKGACVQTAPVLTAIDPSGDGKDLSEGEKPMRLGDSKTGITITGTEPGTPPPACSFTVDIEITDSGQTTVKGS